MPGPGVRALNGAKPVGSPLRSVRYQQQAEGVVVDLADRPEDQMQDRGDEQVEQAAADQEHQPRDDDVDAHRLHRHAEHHGRAGAGQEQRVLDQPLLSHGPPPAARAEALERQEIGGIDRKKFDGDEHIVCRRNPGFLDLDAFDDLGRRAGLEKTNLSHVRAPAWPVRFGDRLRSDAARAARRARAAQRLRCCGSSSTSVGAS